MFKPSPYQQAITTWTREGRGNAIVNAVAGAGKTSTVGLVASEITGTKVYLVFNKHNQISAEKKLGHTGLHVFTCHSFGYRILRANASIANRKIDKNKYRNLVRDLAKADRKFAALDRDEQWEILSPAFKLVDLGRNDLVDPRSEGAEDRLHEVADHHALVLPLGYAEFIMGLVIGALRSGMGKRDGDGQVRLGAVDFGDMLWIPAMYEMREKTYQWVLVDECQDLSAAQRYVAFAAMGKGARMLAVGDPRQAIFGFAGADSSSFAKLAAQADATELPLSVCYRCPRAVVKLAASIVPQIEAAPDAPEGKVTRVREDDVDEMVVEGDMILCRITAPLISRCYSLIASGVPARVKGRDIGSGLVSTFKDAVKLQAKHAGAYNRDTFMDYLAEYEKAAIDELRRRLGDDADFAAESITDRVECVRIVFARCNPSTVADFKAEVDSLFDDKRAAVTLSTVHRAKGLENGRVFILRYSRLGDDSRCEREWQAEQEQNLKYVAITRAQEELVLVG